MTILGISAFYHDSSAAIIRDGKIVAAAQEERFSRIKHDAAFPISAIKFCLSYAGCHIGELDAIAFYDKPLLKFERLLETYYGFAPKGLQSFLKSIPLSISDKLFLKSLIHEQLGGIEEYDKDKIKLLFPEHHLSHAASAFYSSSYNNAAILTIDGVGEWATASISIGKGNSIEILKELHFPHSGGLLYAAFTYYLGFKVNSGEYKLMGLAPYGNPTSPQVAEYIKIIKEKLVDIKPDGSLWLNQEYFNYSTGLTMLHDDKWEKLFGFKKKNKADDLQQHHCNFAYAIQKVTEEVVYNMAVEAKKLTGADYLCMAGGVALNCVANGELLRTKLFKDIFIQPAAGDAGGAIGAAQAAYFIYFNKDRKSINTPDKMQGSYLGPEFSQHEIVSQLKKHKAIYRQYTDFDELLLKSATLISEGAVVGWFQGRMEFGPRALGNRSILGDARNTGMQKKLNLKIKYREDFRPFAPSVIEEDCSEYFDLGTASPYMLITAPVKKQRRNPIPENYYELPLAERLYTLRSDIPAVTHIDFSARVQTVSKETNAPFFRLLDEYKKLTGYGVMLNTSFNVRGEPPVCSPEDAYKCFMRTEMDYLVIGNCLLVKTAQPVWFETDNWKKELSLD